MPVVDNLYIDDINAKEFAKKAQQQKTQTITVTEDYATNIPQYIREKMSDASLQTHREFKQEKSKSQMHYANRHTLAGTPIPERKPDILEPSNVFATQVIMGEGTKLNPGVKIKNLGEQAWKEGLAKGDTLTIFAQATWQASPFGLFDKDKIKASDIHRPNARKAYYLGSILGEASDVAAWTLTGFGLGKALGTSRKAATLVGRLGGKSKIARAMRGTLKGVFVGGEVGKVLIKRAQGYNPYEIAIDIGGDVGSFIGFEKGFKTAIEPRVNEIAIQEKVHSQSQHIVYGERGESIGVGLKGTGEKGWKPTVYSAKTKSIFTSAIDKQRGWVIEEGFDVAGGKGRVSWIGRVKKFMTSAAFKAGRYNPEKPFIVRDMKPAGIMGGGRSVQMSREILQPKEVIQPSASLSGLARTRIISAIKSVQWQELPILGLGTATLLNVKNKKNKKKQPMGQIQHEIENEKQRSTTNVRVEYGVGEIQREGQKVGLTPITTYAQGLIEQIKQELRQDQKQEQEQEHTFDISTQEEPVQIEGVGSTHVQGSILGQAQREEVAQTYLLKLSTPLLATIRPWKQSKIVPSFPVRFRLPTKPSKRAVFMRLKKAWARRVEWGDIKLFGKNRSTKGKSKDKKGRKASKKKTRKNRRRR